MSFDPSAPAGPDSGLFGLGTGPEEAAVHVLGVPFDATASYRRGAAGGPAAILAASHQVDLHDRVTGEPWERGLWMAPLDPRIEAWNRTATEAAERGDTAAVDGIGDELNAWVHRATAAALDAGKWVLTLGGDHSVPFGAIRAHAERHPGLGLLHVDAHADLRVAYEGYAWSHASILHNVVERLPQVGPILQVGLRDLCAEEVAAIEASDGRLVPLYDHRWARARLAGRDLIDLARRHLDVLPEEVYVTFDVDGLDPSLCPGTGTPVPGGLTWHEAMMLLEELARSGRRIVGADLTEVAPRGAAPGEDSWDAIVGARLAYRLIGFGLLSQGG